MLTFFSFVMLLVVCNQSHAIAPNPGATCPSGFVQGSLLSSDYTNLVSAVNTSSYVDIAGTASNRIPLQIKLSSSETNGPPTSGDFQARTTAGNSVFSLTRNYPSLTSVTSLDFEFRNKTTQQPIYLSNVALSAFDIDAVANNSNSFEDYVLFSGVTASGDTINGTYQSISDSNVDDYIDNRDNTPGIGLYNTSINNSCLEENVDTQCQGSVQFSKPVKSVKVRYSNANYRISQSNPTTQEIVFKFDNYCYALPASSYKISKDDGVSSNHTNTTTNYKIKVSNTGEETLRNIVLKDPAVSGLVKQTSITCDSSDTTNVCRTPPTVSKLEQGFSLPELSAGRSYSINVPTQVTAPAGKTVTNKATISHTTLADKSSSDTNNVTSVFGGGANSAPASCPSGHQMYYFGANPPSGATISSSLNWATGNTKNSYKIDDITFTLAFSDIQYLQSDYPTYGDFSNTTNDALNLLHNSPYALVNHRLTATIDKPVSKYGFVVQDLDTNTNRYIESLSFDTSNNNAKGGVFSFSDTLNNALELSNNDQTISGKTWKNCNTGSPCDFNVDWGYQSANTPFVVTHGNIYDTTNEPGQLMGYSDFYFCIAPPKLVVKKTLDGTRINDTNAKRDQFDVSITGNGLTQNNSFTTTGSGATVDNARSSVLELAENTTYTITEKVVNGNMLGEIAGYNASYVCTNATTNSKTVMPTASMTYDADAKTRSFNLSNVAYGDEIICTITNTPSQYTFSGTVFNDNGGINDNDPQVRADNATIDSGIYNNANYFNGAFEKNIESGIANSRVKLVDCASPNTVYDTQTVSDRGATIGQYQFEVPISRLNGNTNVCLVETRSDASYSISTNNSSKSVTLRDNTYNYPDNNFGRVIDKNAALVLKKYQYVHECNPALDYSSIAQSDDPKAGFSTQSINGIALGQCIAYKITATNRANMTINDFKMRDPLQKKGVNNATVTSVLAQPERNASDYADNLKTGDNGTIITNTISIPKRAKRSFYFNTKYTTSASF